MDLDWALANFPPINASRWISGIPTLQSKTPDFLEPILGMINYGRPRPSRENFTTANVLLNGHKSSRSALYNLRLLCVDKHFFSFSHYLQEVLCGRLSKRCGLFILLNAKPLSYFFFSSSFNIQHVQAFKQRRRFHKNKCPSEWNNEMEDKAFASSPAGWPLRRIDVGLADNLIASSMCSTLFGAFDLVWEASTLSTSILTSLLEQFASSSRSSSSFSFRYFRRLRSLMHRALQATNDNLLAT